MASRSAMLPAVCRSSASRSSADYIFERLRAAFEVVRGDDRGRQIAMYELTTWALRTPDMDSLARRQYAAYRRVASALAEPWLSRGRGEDTAPQLRPDVLNLFLSALFDGLVLAWLADPETADPDAVFALVSRLLSSAGETEA